MKKRVHGFLQEAIAEIHHRPGQSAWEIVDRLTKSGRAQSAAFDPHPSLEGTLHKHYAAHGVERRKEGGIFRFYPIGSESPSEPPRTTAANIDESETLVPVTVRLPRRITDVADTLVATGTCSNRVAAVAWLIEKGISSLRA